MAVLKDKLTAVYSAALSEDKMAAMLDVEKVL